VQVHCIWPSILLSDLAKKMQWGKPGILLLFFMYACTYGNEAKEDTVFISAASSDKVGPIRVVRLLGPEVFYASETACAAPSTRETGGRL
jgi:hypothetical protein